MPSENVQVAVLVRPYNEKERKEDSKCIVEAKGGEINVHNTETEKAKAFKFDYSVGLVPRDLIIYVCLICISYSSFSVYSLTKFKASSSKLFVDNHVFQFCSVEDSDSYISRHKVSFKFICIVRGLCTTGIVGAKYIDKYNPSIIYTSTLKSVWDKIPKEVAW
jgi:hypothetical protein